MKYLNFKLLIFFAALALAIPPAWAGTVTYTMTLDANANNGTKNVHWTTPNQTLTWNNVSWDATADNSPAWGNSTTEVQMGTAKKPTRNVSISTSGFTGTIKRVSVTAKTAKDATASVKLSVGGVEYKNTNLTTDYIEYAGAGSSSGEIVIEFSQPSTSKALYINAISVTYETGDNEPWIDIDPPSLDINDEGGIFTVSCDNMPDGGLGANVVNMQNIDPTKFSFSNPEGYNSFDEGDNYFPLQGETHALTDGKVKVDYTGYALSAMGLIDFSSGNQHATAKVNYLYDGDIYIVGNVNEYSWNEPVAGVLMDKTNGTYTAQVTVNGGGYFYFTKQVGAANYNVQAGRFGPRCNENGQAVGGKTWTPNSETLGIYCDLDTANNLNTFQLTPGNYIITINPATNKFMIEEYVAPNFRTFKKVTAANQLVAGKEYIIVCDNKAMGAEATGNFLTAIDITGGDVVEVGDNVAIMTLGGSLGHYTLALDNKYLSASNSTALSIGTNATEWAISDFNGTLDGYRVKHADYDRSVKYQANNNRFGNYSSGDANSEYGWIYVADDGTPTVDQVAKPTFSPAEGEKDGVVDVAISCTTQDATIHYTLDGSEPTSSSDVYSAPIHLTESKTIKAIAVKDGMDDSEVATATYTLPISVATVVEANGKEDNTKFIFTGNVVVTYSSGNYTWLRDLNATEGGGVLNNNNNITVPTTPGAVWSTEWNATKKSNNSGRPQYENANNIIVNEQPASVTVEPFDRTGVELTDVHMSEYIKLENVKINSFDDDKTYVGSCAKRDNDVVNYTLYNYFNIEGMQVDKTYDITGVVTRYNGNAQVYPTAINLKKQNPGLSFTPSSVTVYEGVGENFTEPALTKPEDLGVDVTYGSRNADVATVDENGNVTIVGVGNTTITASVAESTYYTAGTATYDIVVKAKEPAGLSFGVTEPVTATYGDTEFDEPALTNDANLPVTYESSDTTVVKVDASGNVTIVGAGNATITATTIGDDSHAGGSASYTIEVAKADATLSFAKATIEATFGDETVEANPLTNEAGLEVTYSCEPETVATVDAETGKVTIVGAGTATVTATGAANDNYNLATATYTLTIAKADATLSFAKEGIEATIGDETVEANPLTNTAGLTITYSCKPESVATVDAVTGEVTINGVGSATVTATGAANDNYNLATATYTITVNDVVVAIADLTFSPAAGTYTEPKEVAIACATPGVTIEYKIGDGAYQPYTKPFMVTNSCTVTAKASKGSKTIWTDSEASATYTINVLPAANIADGYYNLVNNSPEVEGLKANVAGRRTMNFVSDAADKAGTVFRIASENGKVKTLRSQGVDLQGYAERAMNYVDPIVNIVISKLTDMENVDDPTGAGTILGQEGLGKLVQLFKDNFDSNLYVEGNEGAYRIYGRTPSMQSVVDFYNDPENTEKIEAKLPELEGYINQVLNKVRAKVESAGLNGEVIPEFKLVDVWQKMGGNLIKPEGENVLPFYRQVLTNKEYVWNFAMQATKIYLDAIKRTTFYQEMVPAEYGDVIDKLESVRPETKYFIIQRSRAAGTGELDYISENNNEIINNDPRTFWSLPTLDNFTVNFPEENVYGDKLVTTLYTDFAYDLNGLEAYKVTGVENDNAVLEAIEGTVPAQTPVILMTAKARGNVAKTVKLSTSDAAAIESELKGPDDLVKEYGLTSPTVDMLFMTAEGIVGANLMEPYQYLRLKTSGTVNNKYFWALPFDPDLKKCVYTAEGIDGDDCVVRSLAVEDGTLAFSDHWTVETNKAFLVNTNYAVINLMLQTVATPTISLADGTYDTAQTVTISCATDDAIISYSTDGGLTWTEGTTVTVDETTILLAKATKAGMNPSDEACAAYVIKQEAAPLQGPEFDGYYSILNNGNNKYANVQGRKTLTFTDSPATQPGTVIYVKTDETGQVQSLRSQGADLQGYADRAMRYVPEIVQKVVDKLHAEGAGNLLGESGYEAIMEKFNESFDYHLYVEEADGGYRLYGKTPSMQPVVDFYAENKSNVDAKLPMLEQFINDAIDKVLEKTGGHGESILQPFHVHDTWDRMGRNLTEPVDSASTMRFYQQVLCNKENVWNFAYETVLTYWERVKAHPRYEELKDSLGEFANYIDKLEQIRPDMKYYVVQNNGKPDYISAGNTDIINNEPRTIWTLEDRTKFTVNIPESNVFGCAANADADKHYAITLYTDFAYTLPDGVTAYTVAGVNNMGVAQLEYIGSFVPAQTPILLVAETAGDKELTLSTSNAAAIESELKGPDYLIENYKLTTPQVEGLFTFVKRTLGESFYENNVAQYEHLMYLNSGTVNNKYFWGLTSENVAKCIYKNEGNEEDCVVRNLSAEGNTLAFIDNWTVTANKAFLVTDKHNTITLWQRGDANHDGKINIADVTTIIYYLLTDDAELSHCCTYCGDVSEDNKMTIKDVTVLINYLLTVNESGDIVPIHLGGGED